MGNKTLMTGAIGASVSLLGRFELFSMIFGALQLTTLLDFANKYSDFLFLPGYGLFGIILIFALFRSRNDWITYLVSVVTILFMVDISIRGEVYLGLLFVGIVLGIIALTFLQDEKDSNDEETEEQPAKKLSGNKKKNKTRSKRKK